MIMEWNNDNGVRCLVCAEFARRFRLPMPLLLLALGGAWHQAVAALKRQSACTGSRDAVPE